MAGGGIEDGPMPAMMKESCSGPLTFSSLASRTIDLVRRTSTSVLLILVLATSASACVAGWGQQEASSSHSSDRQACTGRKQVVSSPVRAGCGHVLKSLPGRCGMRSFIQFQFVAFHAFQISAPFRRATGNISRPPDAVIIVSSIGSPETDRGPPRS